MTALSFDDPPPARAQTFDDLYAAYADRVRAYARVRLGDTHLADDVVQETFLRVYRFQDRLDPSRPAWPWVKAIASTMCANAVRGRRNTAESVVGDLEADPEAAAWLESGLDHRGPEHHALLAENRRQLAGVLNGLADGHREVLLQKDLLGLTVGEIAARGGASPDSVKSLVVRARSAFRRSWDRAGHGRLAALAPWLRRGRADHVAGTLVLTGVVPS
ncbi:MAG: polymerase sigma-70 factor, subfamily, partial [Actinomycetota bacterium]|nr:polymerase sigma-70 factor, subfamily [Actinomycetota bacterium]